VAPTTSAACPGSGVSSPWRPERVTRDGSSSPRSSAGSREPRPCADHGTTTGTETEAKKAAKASSAEVVELPSAPGTHLGRVRCPPPRACVPRLIDQHGTAPRPFPQGAATGFTAWVPSRAPGHYVRVATKSLARPCIRRDRCTLDVDPRGAEGSSPSHAAPRSRAEGSHVSVANRA